MPDTYLTNQAALLGTYGNDPFETNTTLVETRLVDGFLAVKTADKEVWQDGYLTYTITFTNNADEDLEDAQFKDQLDITKVTLVENSVKVNDTIVTYSYVDGLLTVELGDFEVGLTIVVTFQVQKI